MKSLVSLSVIAILLGLVPVARVGSQTPPVLGIYVSGWNMVGGPPGTDFSSASFLQQWTPTGYVTPNSAKAVACQGYWAWFNTPATITLPAEATGSTQTCQVRAGWNLIGNPFAGIAQIPNGYPAYYWNAATNKYSLVQAIPAGGAAWLYASETTSISLHYQSTTTPAPATLVISGLYNLGPYRVHVGDSIELLLASAIGYRANVNANFLHLQTAGETGPLSCLGATSCALSLVNQIWIWNAILPGTTSITVSQVCAPATTACANSMEQIEIDIAP